MYEISDDIYGMEYSMRYARKKELMQANNLASYGKVRLTANALVSRLIKQEFGLATYRDPSGRNSKYVYYPLNGYSDKEYEDFYYDEFLPFLDRIRSQYPDLYIDARLSNGNGPMLQVYGPDYAWDKNTHEAEPLN